MNKVILVGKIMEDPTYYKEEIKLCYIRVATKRSFKGKDGEWKTFTDFHRITLWRALADQAVAEATKGQDVYIEGRISYDSYNDKSGTKVYRTSIVGEGMQLIGSESASPDREDDDEGNGKAAAFEARGHAAVEDEDDIPF